GSPGETCARRCCGRRRPCRRPCRRGGVLGPRAPVPVALQDRILRVGVPVGGGRHGALLGRDPPSTVRPVPTSLGAAPARLRRAERDVPPPSVWPMPSIRLTYCFLESMFPVLARTPSPRARQRGRST